MRLHRHITTSAAAWEASDRDEGELYRGGRLDAGGQWSGENTDDLNESELAFVAASQELHRSEELAKARSARRLRRSLVAVAIVAVVAIVAGGFAWTRQRAANTNKRAADAAALNATKQRDAATAAAADAEQQRQAADSAKAEADQQRQTAVDTAYAAETHRMAGISTTLVNTDPAGNGARSRSQRPHQRPSDTRSVAERTVCIAGARFDRPGYLVTQADSIPQVTS